LREYFSINSILTALFFAYELNTSLIELKSLLHIKRFGNKTKVLLSDPFVRK